MGAWVARTLATSFEGASSTSRDLINWNPRQTSADAEIIADQAKLVARARDLDRNSGIARGGVQTILDNVVGTGLRLSARPAYAMLGKPKEWADEWARTVEAQFQSWYWTTACHAGDTLTGDQITAQIFRAALVNGEGVALPLWIPDRGDGWSTKIQTVESDRLSQPAGIAQTTTFRAGIEFDAYGVPLAYHIRKRHPGDSAIDATGVSEWERVPRRFPTGRVRVLHVFDSERAGQSRGVPLTSAILPHFKQADRYSKAELDAAVANALIAAVVTTPMEADDIVDLFSKDREAYLKARRDAAVSLESASMISLFPGDKLESFIPARPATAFEAFITSVYGQIGVGLGLPRELLLKDFTKTTYSSARAALLEAGRSFNRRRDWLVTTWMDPIYRLWLEEAVSSGKVDAPDFYANRWAYERCRWIGPGRGWVDPVREAEAAKFRIEAGLSTYEDECAEQGRDWREVFEQQAFERAERARLGLPDPSANPAAPAVAPGVDPNADPTADPETPGTPTDRPAKSGGGSA